MPVSEGPVMLAVCPVTESHIKTELDAAAVNLITRDQINENVLIK